MITMTEECKTYFRLCLPSNPADDDGIHRFPLEAFDKRRFPCLRKASVVLFWWATEGGKLTPVWTAQ